MEKIVYLLIGAAITWGLYFIQRRVERRRTTEAIERNQKLLNLKQGLEQASTSLEELRQFENRLIGKAEAAVKIAGRYVSQAGEVARRSDSLLAHDDFAVQAVADFQRVDARLDDAVAHLRKQLDGADLAAFEQVHLAWLAFRERYARFIAQSYSGGAIQPLIHAVTLESITAAWIAELETQLGDEDPDAGSDDDADAND
ncbi:lysozyme inhibitor LprI family protein [Lysobacter yangpyeongensis]|uniref:Lysozyme inhibitor LprI family protein n=1 Tax=Lysobacter yangpyeongensis TaxID=346182 RepID=A0ABW0SRI6_9GAMM